MDQTGVRLCWDLNPASRRRERIRARSKMVRATLEVFQSIGTFYAGLGASSDRADWSVSCHRRTCLFSIRSPRQRGQTIR